MNPATRTVGAIRAFALAVATVAFAAIPGHRTPSILFNGTAHQQLETLRHRTHDLFAAGQYSEAADLFASAYRQAVAQNEPEYAIRFLNGLGGTQFALFEYQSALDTLLRARDLARSRGDPIWISTVSSNLCSLYMQAGDMAAAKLAAESGLRVPADASLPYRSQLLAILGLLESNSGNGVKALTYLREAVDSAEMNGPDRLRLEAWSHYAKQLLREGDLDGAETAALNTYRLGKLAGVREMRPAYLTLARIHRARGNSGLALALIERGLAIPAREGDRQLWRMYFLYERAMVRISTKQLSAAVSDLRAALSFAGRWREALAPSDSLHSRAEFWLKGLYDAYIDATARQGAIADAFLAVEEERAASLIEMLLASPRGPGRSDQYWRDLASLRAAEIARIATPSPSLERKTAQIRQRLLEEEARTGIPPPYRAAAPPYRAATARERLPNIERTIAPNEALISLHLGDPVSYIWALTNAQLEMHPLAPAHKLAGLAARFRRSVRDGAAERDTLGAELYTELFGKLSARVLGKAAWLVASDDSLFEVPFAALVVQRKYGRPVYLVERHETARIPSADVAQCGFAARWGSQSWLQPAFQPVRLDCTSSAGPASKPGCRHLVAQVSSPVSPQSAASGQFLGIGDGIYNTADPRFTRTHERPPILAYGVPGYMAVSSAPVKPQLELPRLVSSAFELESCAAAWNPRQRAVLLTGRDASQERLRQTLATKPAIVHIAAHILYPNGQPDQALIHLGLKPTGESEALTTRDVTSLQAGGALVVLSGCSSAAGNSVRGAGVMGLPRAWLLAGARGVVGSRWPVPDETGELFRSFYSHLAATGLSRSGQSSALRQARLDMLRSNTWRADPRYWGAFYLLTTD